MEEGKVQKMYRIKNISLKNQRIANAYPISINTFEGIVVVENNHTVLMSDEAWESAQYPTEKFTYIYEQAAFGQADLYIERLSIDEPVEDKPKVKSNGSKQAKK